VPTQRKYWFVTSLAFLITILSIYVHRHRQGKTGPIDNILISMSGGAQTNLFYLTHGGRKVFDHYFFLVNAQKRNDELTKEIDLMRTKLVALQEVEAENGRLRESLAFQSRVQAKLLSAHVVATDVSSDYTGIRIDKGSKDGVQVGMGIISPAGLVGRVQRVSQSYSDILTVLDPTSNVDGIVQRSRARGIVSGQSKQVQCKMKYLDRLDDIAVNDVIVSSGFGSVFPKGLLIGTVSSVTLSSNGILQLVTVKTAVDIYQLEEVFIVLSSPESEKTS